MSANQTKPGSARIRLPGVWGLVLLIGLMPWAPGPAAGGETDVGAALAAHGVRGAAAERILRCFAECAPYGIPTEALFARLREGLVKQADPDLLADALERRRETLARAQTLLPSATGRFRRQPHSVDLLEALANALESGVPPAAFDGLVPPGRRVRQDRISAVIEAGEMLHLAGVETPDVRWFMHEARSRDSGRAELLRVARVWVQLRREGYESEEIRGRIWDARAFWRPEAKKNPSEKSESGIQ